MATPKSTIRALRPSGNHAKVCSGSSVVLPSLDIEGGSPAIWLEIDVSVRKRVLETPWPKNQSSLRDCHKICVSILLRN